VNRERLGFRYQGRGLRLTDIHGEIMKSVLAQVRGIARVIAGRV
jgi:hypothetical protein